MHCWAGFEFDKVAEGRLSVHSEKPVVFGLGRGEGGKLRGIGGSPCRQSNISSFGTGLLENVDGGLWIWEIMGSLLRRAHGELGARACLLPGPYQNLGISEVLEP